MSDTHDSSRRKFLQHSGAAVTAAALSPGFLADSHVPTPLVDPVQADAPHATLMLMGGGVPEVSLEELRKLHETQPHQGREEFAMQCDTAGLHQKLLSLSPKERPTVLCLTNASCNYPRSTGEQYKLLLEGLGAGKVEFYAGGDDPPWKNAPTPEEDADTFVYPKGQRLGGEITTRQELARRIKSADIVLITGGDQERLAEVFTREDEIYRLLRDRIQHDRDFVYGGNSAGSMIISSLMIADSGKGTDVPKTDKGFGFLPISVETHRSEIAPVRNQRLPALTRDNPDAFGIGLDCTTAVIFRNGIATVHAPDTVRQDGRVLKRSVLVSRGRNAASLPGLPAHFANRTFTHGQHFELGPYWCMSDKAPLADPNLAAGRRRP